MSWAHDASRPINVGTLSSIVSATGGYRDAQRNQPRAARPGRIDRLIGTDKPVARRKMLRPSMLVLPSTALRATHHDLPGRPFASKIGIWDWRTGKDDAHDFGPRQLVEEFVPVSSGTRTLLMGTTINLDTQRSELHVFDARRVAAGPLVSWSANMALPVSFHGNWLNRNG